MTRDEKPSAASRPPEASRGNDAAEAGQMRSELLAELRAHISGRSADRARAPGLPWRSAARSAIRMIETRYQPIVRMRDRKLVGLEVLARLNHPSWGFLLPEMFIPQIESAGLAPQLTDVVAMRALADLDSGFVDENGVSLAINLPLDVLLFPSAFDRMELQRQWAGVDAARLTIELTESRPVTDLPGLDHAIARWRGAGYRLALDDIGHAVPNYRILLKLPFNAAKLDKVVVQEAASSEAARRLVVEVVEAAHREGMTVVAEGIENQEAWTRLGEMGADEAQGYLISQPLASADVPAWLAEWDQATG